MEATLNVCETTGSATPYWGGGMLGYPAGVIVKWGERPWGCNCKRAIVGQGGPTDGTPVDGSAGVRPSHGLSSPYPKLDFRLPLWNNFL